MIWKNKNKIRGEEKQKEKTNMHMTTKLYKIFLNTRSGTQNEKREAHIRKKDINPSFKSVFKISILCVLNIIIICSTLLVDIIVSCYK